MAMSKPGSIFAERGKRREEEPGEERPRDEEPEEERRHREEEEEEKD